MSARAAMLRSPKPARGPSPRTDPVVGRPQARDRSPPTPRPRPRRPAAWRITLESDSRRTASSCSPASPSTTVSTGPSKRDPGLEAEALAGVGRQLQHAGRSPPRDDSSACRSKIVVRMSLMTLSSSATISRSRSGGDVGHSGQHGAQPHARPEDPLDHEVVQVAGDAVAVVGHLEGAQVLLGLPDLDQVVRPGPELGLEERLEQVVVGPRHAGRRCGPSASLRAVRMRIGRGVDARLGPHGADQFVAAHLGHHEVADDEVGPQRHGPARTPACPSKAAWTRYDAASASQTKWFMSGLSSTTRTSGTVIVVGRPGAVLVTRRQRPAAIAVAVERARAAGLERAASCPSAAHGGPGGAADGELDDEERAALGRVVDPDGAAVQLDQLAGDVQAEPVPPSFRVEAAVELVEALEDLVARRPAGCPGRCRPPRRGRRAPVASALPQLQRGPSRRGRRELERVGQQVQQDLLQAGRVDLRRNGAVGCHAPTKSTARSTRQRLEVVGDEAHQMGRGRARAVLELELGRFELGRVEQVVDVPEQDAGVAQDHLEVAPVRVVGPAARRAPLGRGRGSASAACAARG